MEGRAEGAGFKSLPKLTPIGHVLQKPRVDSSTPRRSTPPMAKSPAPAPASTCSVTVREVPIELCQFIKFGGLADSGGAAKQLIAEGGVLLNGVVETRKRKKLAAGDRVMVGDRTIVVALA